MDSNNGKCLSLFLLSQRDKYIKHLIRTGVKLTKTGNFNEETFVEQFIPNKDLIIQKIKEKVEDDIEVSKDGGCAKICIDSYLFEKLRKEVDDFRKDLDDVRKNTNPHNKEDVKQSTETMETASNCGSINEKLSSNDEQRTNKYVQKSSDNGYNIYRRSNNNYEDDSHSIVEELLPGQLSTFFVQKNKVNVVKKKIQKPDFDGPNNGQIIEQFSLYRHPK